MAVILSDSEESYTRTKSSYFIGYLSILQDSSLLLRMKNLLIINNLKYVINDSG